MFDKQLIIPHRMRLTPWKEVRPEQLKMTNIRAVLRNQLYKRNAWKGQSEGSCATVL